MIQATLSTPTLLAVTSIEAHPISGGIQLMVVGMLVVFTALLCILALLTSLKVFCAEEATMQTTSSSPANSPPMATLKSAPGSASIDSDELDPKVMAAITAAIAFTVRKPVRIRYVKLVQRDAHTTWAEKGRMSLQSTHRLRKGQR